MEEFRIADAHHHFRDLSPNRYPWWQAMRLAASVPNFAVRISGGDVPGAAWTVDLDRGVVLDTIDIFGTDRCMFASNFPVDGIVADYATIFGGFQETNDGFPRGDREKLFHDNAVRFYRLNPNGEGYRKWM